MPGVSMFTVKHYSTRGVLKVCSCERFELNTEAPTEIAISSRAEGSRLITLSAGETVFVENMNGKTVAIARG